jgi:hypothetical protein
MNTSRIAIRGLVLWGLLSSLAWSQTRRLVFEETEIEGKVQKPEITIFITRQNLHTDYQLELRESFIPKIIQSVEEKPF